MIYGGDIEQLADLHAAFTTEACTTRDLVARIGGRLAGVTWTGPAADRFRAAWHDQFQPALSGLAEALDEASAEVVRRREALVQVSL